MIGNSAYLFQELILSF